MIVSRACVCVQAAAAADRRQKDLEQRLRDLEAERDKLSGEIRRTRDTKDAHIAQLVGDKQE